MKEGILYHQLKWRIIAKAINVLNLACIARASIEIESKGEKIIKLTKASLEKIIIKQLGVSNVLGSKINKWVFKKKMSTYQIK